MSVCELTGVHLIDEKDDRSGSILHLFQYGLEALFELAAVAGTGDQRADIERPNAAMQIGRHVALHNATCKTFDDRSLA